MSRRRKPNSRRPDTRPRGLVLDVLTDPLAPWDAMLRTLDDGTRAAFLSPVVPDDAPPEVREGIARRRLLYSEGRCPCGAVLALPPRGAVTPGALHLGSVEHSDGCPATDDALMAALRRWEGQA